MVSGKVNLTWMQAGKYRSKGYQLSPESSQLLHQQSMDKIAMGKVAMEDHHLREMCIIRCIYLADFV